MLTVYLGRDYVFMKNKVSDVSGYFDNSYDKEWFNSDFAEKVVEVIDGVKHLSGDVFINERFGAITARELSSGAKALILLNNMPELLISGDRMGNNCVPFLVELASIKDIKITLCHVMQFPKGFEFYCIPFNKKIQSEDEYLSAWEEVRPYEASCGEQESFIYHKIDE